MSADESKPVNPVREMPEVPDLLDPLRNKTVPSESRGDMCRRLGNELLQHFHAMAEKSQLTMAERCHVAAALVWGYTDMACSLEREGKT